MDELTITQYEKLFNNDLSKEYDMLSKEELSESIERSFQQNDTLLAYASLECKSFDDKFNMATKISKTYGGLLGICSTEGAVGTVVGGAAELAIKLLNIIKNVLITIVNIIAKIISFIFDKIFSGIKYLLKKMIKKKIDDNKRLRLFKKMERQGLVSIEDNNEDQDIIIIQKLQQYVSQKIDSTKSNLEHYGEYGEFAYANVFACADYLKWQSNMFLYGKNIEIYLTKYLQPDSEICKKECEILYNISKNKLSSSEVQPNKLATDVFEKVFNYHKNNDELLNKKSYLKFIIKGSDAKNYEMINFRTKKWVEEIEKNIKNGLTVSQKNLNYGIKYLKEINNIEDMKNIRTFIEKLKILHTDLTKCRNVFTSISTSVDARIKIIDVISNYFSE